MMPDDIDEDIIVAAFEAFAGRGVSPKAKRRIARSPAAK
jgi:hypothetical protein